MGGLNTLGSILFLSAYSVINLFRNVLLRIQEGTSIDIPWLWNRTDKLHYFDTVGFYRRRSEKKKKDKRRNIDVLNDWMKERKFWYTSVVFHDSSKSVELLNLSYTLYFTFEPR